MPPIRLLCPVAVTEIFNRLPAPKVFHLSHSHRGFVPVNEEQFCPDAEQPDEKAAPRAAQRLGDSEFFSKPPDVRISGHRGPSLRP